MELSLDDLTSSTGATVRGAGRGRVTGVSIDTRSLAPGELFVAVVADRDGHDFVDAAVAAGAGAVLVERPHDVEVTQLIVDDTLAALARVGRLARDLLDGPVVGITGSVGKTSTKDLLAAVCRRAGVTTASERSLNNEMGVPLTLANALPGTQRTIVEMGARGPGHIADLCRIARPTVGIVTAVAPAHTEMFGSVDGVAIAKRELVESLGPGTAVLNGEDHRVAAMAEVAEGPVLTYGTGGDVRALRVEIDDQLRPSFLLATPWGEERVRLGVRGGHNVGNALAAAAAALVTGVELAAVASGLGDAQLSPSRMALVRLPSGGLLLDDSYNANPTSMRSALASLAHLDVRRRVAVVGVMAELGPESAAHHREIAEEAAAAGIELVPVGTDLYGVEPVADPEALLTTIGPPAPGEAVLLKGSRVAGLDRVARAWHPADPPAP